MASLGIHTRKLSINKICNVCFTEQYEQAIDDFKKCLKIQEEYLEKDSRLIAETHYQIGLACCFSQKYEESLEHLNKAVRVINAKIREYVYSNVVA